MSNRRMTAWFEESSDIIVFEGEEAMAVMAELYETYNLLVNYFFPSMKIQKKERIDAKVTKKYDDAKTPYSRLIECESLPEEAKQELQTKLIALAVPWSK